MSAPTKHTAGPWTLTTVPTDIGSCHKIGTFPGPHHRPENYACVYADTIRIGIDEATPRAQELLANARLIAAAPDLLAALQEMLLQHGVRGGDGASQQAREAIAKALGADQ